eukprot:1150497-Pelagomonas_calceolata.AAC.2
MPCRFQDSCGQVEEMCMVGVKCTCVTGAESTGSGLGGSKLHSLRSTPLSDPNTKGLRPRGLRLKKLVKVAFAFACQAEGSITSLRSQRVTANTAARWLAFEQLMKP